MSSIQTEIPTRIETGYFCENRIPCETQGLCTKGKGNEAVSLCPHKYSDIKTRVINGILSPYIPGCEHFSADSSLVTLTNELSNVA